MLLKAESANDESRWVRGLTLQIDLVHGGTFQGPPSVKNRRRSIPRLMDGGGGDGCRERGRGGGLGTGRGEGGAGESKEQLDGEWEGNQFREIHDRIRAVVDDRHGPSVGGKLSQGFTICFSCDITCVLFSFSLTASNLHVIMGIAGARR